jgi:iron complex outermembrane recepter protein
MVKLKLFILGSASAFAIVGASQAYAQDAAGEAQAAEQGDASGVADTDIVVTGLRESLGSAQAIKKNAIQQVDSIVAEDIGKLPDVAVSDVAARITGVQVVRSEGEANRVLVRGLPDFTTTFNGREIFTDRNRSVALQDFPVGAIAALNVYKTTTADLVEGGLAGLVNVQGRRPFDFSGLEVSGSLWGQYTKRSKTVRPNGNLLISDRWDTGIGEIGLLLNASDTRFKYTDSTRSNPEVVVNVPFGPNGSNVRYPDAQLINYGIGDRERPSINGVLQWRPSPGLEFYAEGLWQGFRSKRSDRQLYVPFWGGSNYSNVVTTGTGPNPRVETMTVANPARPDGYQGATFDKTNTTQFAIGGKYDGDQLHISADLARTKSQYSTSVNSFDFAYANRLPTVTLNTGVGNINNGPSFVFPSNPDLTNPANYIYRGFYERLLIAKGNDVQARLDFSYDTEVAGLTKVAFGLRYVNRDASFQDGDRYNNREGDRISFAALRSAPYNVSLDYAVFNSPFPNNDPTSVRGYLTPTYDSIRNNIDALRILAGFPNGTPSGRPDVTYAANEKSYAGYGQLNYEFGDPDGFHVDGALGLRVVITKLKLDGPGLGTVNFVPRIIGREYADWLPNASARIVFTPTLQARLSYTETRTRPNFIDYNPGVALDPPGQTPPGGPRFGNGGNPDLNPLRSKNFDASLEYYFSRTGSIAGAIFRRNTDGFIQYYSTFDRASNQSVRRPYNSGKGRIEGFELQTTTFLDFGGLPEWASGFGVQANVTYIKSDIGFPQSLGGTITQRPVIGLSKWTYNLAGFYDKNGFMARLSYNYRSGFESRFEPIGYRGGPDIYSERTNGIGRLDFSTSYNLTNNITLTADANNILAKPLTSILTYGFNDGKDPAVFPRSVRYEESVYSLGVRFRL